MKNILLKGVSILTAFSMICYATPVYADEEAVSATDEQIEDYFASGIEVGRKIAQIEDELGIDLNWNPANYSASDYSAEWVEDARVFLDNTLSQHPMVEAQTEESDMEAASIGYSIQCARWSMAKGRGHDLAEESAYMFLSHYVDIPEYYGDTTDSFLLNGPSRSEAPKYYSKWITDNDRNAYNLYTGLHAAGTGMNTIFSTMRDALELGNNAADIVSATEVADKTSEGLSAASDLLSVRETIDNVDDFRNDLLFIVNRVTTSDSEEAEKRVSSLYDEFFNNDDLFRTSEDEVRHDLIIGGLSCAVSLVLGTVTGGIIDDVPDTVSGSLINLGQLVVLSEIEGLSWLFLSYSYHSRMPLRMYDYYMDNI